MDAIKIAGGAATFADLDIAERPGNVVVRFAGTEIVIENADASQIAADDFTFG